MKSLWIAKKQDNSSEYRLLVIRHLFLKK